MKVFMSWSGQRSKLTAELLNDWVKCVIQAAQPWISTRGIERGALWSSEINSELRDTSVGIICITQDNKNAPWILFEAGAIAKGLDNNRVCTFLVDLQPADLEPPLAQFNHTFPTRDSMWSLVNTLNNSLESGRLQPTVLERVFETYWPQFETDFKVILENNPQQEKAKPRPEKDMLAELLDLNRSMSQRIRSLEEQATPRLRRAIATHVAANGISSNIVPNDEIAIDKAIAEVSDLVLKGASRNRLIAHLVGQGFDRRTSDRIIETAEVVASYKPADKNAS